MPIQNIEDFKALDPFLRAMEQGLGPHCDGEHYFDMLAQDVVFDFIITIPDYPRHIVGRDALIELYRGYRHAFTLDRVHDLRVHHDPVASTVVLEYSSAGVVTATGYPSSNRYISVAEIEHRKIVRWRDYLDPLRVFAAMEGRPFVPDAAAG